MNHTTPLTLVTGGSGKTGRRVAQRLVAAGRAVRIATRSTPARFDWHDPTMWPAALAGVDAVYLAVAPDLAFPGTDDIVGEFTHLAVNNGVATIVPLSGRGEPAAARCEHIVASSGRRGRSSAAVGSTRTSANTFCSTRCSRA